MNSILINTAVERMFTYDDYLEYLYKDNDRGLISVFRKGFKGSIYTKAYRKEKLAEGLGEYFEKGYITDLYMTLNTFINNQRTIDSLRYLNALYIDIDCYKQNLSKERVLYELEYKYYNRMIPEPSLVVDSGRGLYLIWFIDPVPSMALSLWKAMQYFLYDKLKSLGADRAALDAARVLRIPGSINTKSNTTVKAIQLFYNRYTLKNLKNNYLPEVVEKKEQKKEFKGKIVRLFNDYTLYKARMHDIEKLIELRNYDIENREVTLFMYRYYASLSEGEETAEILVKELNNKLYRSLPASEVNFTKTNYPGKYKYKNSTMIDLLDVQADEMEQMKTLISKEYKYKKNNERRKNNRRNEKGLTKRQEGKQKKQLYIFIYGNEKTNKEISEKLNISVRMVQNYKKEINSDESLRMVLMDLMKEEILNDENEKMVL